MKRRAKSMRKLSVAKIATALATVSGVALMWNIGSQGALACGPFAKTAVFSHSSHPDYPFTKYAQGELGIIQPTFARSYLVVAYRYFTGAKTSPEKQKELVALWNRRIAPVNDGLINAVKAWLAQRTLVKSVPFKVTEDYSWNNWTNGYVNYLNPAFYAAADDLKAKIAKYGADDNRVKDWVRAQDQVFAGASVQKMEGADAPPPLAELPATADKEQLADRAYQMASKDFYDGKFADAATKFQAIGKDASSRWQKWGLYMAARSLCRKATSGESIDLGELGNAQKLVDEILQSKDLASMHANAQHLGHFIQYRVDPDSRVRELAKELVGPGEKVDFDEALGDYTCLLDHYFARPEPGEEETPTAWNGSAPSGVAPTAWNGGSTVLGKNSGSGGSGTSEPGSAAELAYLACALAVVALGLGGLMRSGTARDGFKRGRIVSMLTLSTIMLSIGTVACSSSTKSTKPVDEAKTDAKVAQDETKGTTLVAEPKINLDDDMTVWINNFIDTKPVSADLALKKWQETKSVHWLVSAISKLKATTPNSQAVLKEAEKIGTDSPAYFTVAYHRARLAKEAGGKDAVSILKQALEVPAAKLPPSARNLLLDQKLDLCSSLDEFAKTASPAPATIAWDYDIAELPEPESDFAKANKTGDYLVYPGCLTDEATDIINQQLPISAIEKLATNPALPQNVRMNLAQAGWVRSVLLKNDKSAMTLLPVLATLNPSLKTGLDAYKNAAPADKEFAAISLILRNPAMQPYARAGLDRETPFNKIDNYRDNWWCDRAPDTNSGYGYVSGNDQDKEAPKGPDLAFLTAAEKKSGQDEYAALKKVGTAPNFLAKKVVDYSKAHPKDANLPEVLHLAVSATRYGCTNDETTTFSKAAYQELHKNFPGNPWTKKTKFWF